jgi:uncharacterized protein (DUF2147 family)
MIPAQALWRPGMKTSVFWIAMMVVITASPAFANDGQAIVGVWLTEPDEVDGQAHVEFFEKDGRYFGKITWLEKPLVEEGDDGAVGQPKLDINNPDPALRDQPIIGLTIVEDFQYKGKNHWVKGTIYDPGNGKKYKSKIWLQEDGSLKVRGFVGVSLLGRNEIWTPVEVAE